MRNNCSKFEKNPAAIQESGHGLEITRIWEPAPRPNKVALAERRTPRGSAGRGQRDRTKIDGGTYLEGWWILVWSEGIGILRTEQIDFGWILSEPGD